MSRKNQDWRLQRGVRISEEAAKDVAAIACALKSLAVFTTLIVSQEDLPPDLREMVDEGLASIDRLFIW